MTFDHHTSLDERLFRTVNSGAGRLADALAVALSSNLFGLAIGFALAAVILMRRGRKRIELLVAFALAIFFCDFLGAHLLRPLFGRMRPCFALLRETVRWLAPAADVGSLPSLHAANFFAMAVIGTAALGRSGIALFALAAAVALSRLYVGVHWPSDVAAGAAWGVLCAWAGLGLSARAFRRRRGGPADGTAPKA